MKIPHIKQCRVWRADKAKVQAVLRCAGGGSIDFMAVELVRSWPTTSLETVPVFSLLFSPLFPLPTPPPEPPLPVETRRPQENLEQSVPPFPPRSWRRKFLVERMLRLIRISGAPGNTLQWGPWGWKASWPHDRCLWGWTEPYIQVIGKAMERVCHVEMRWNQHTQESHCYSVSQKHTIY